MAEKTSRTQGGSLGNSGGTPAEGEPKIREGSETPAIAQGTPSGTGDIAPGATVADHRPDLISAWRTGGLASRLEWDLQKAVLKKYGLSIGLSKFEQALNELAMVARDLVGPIVEKDRLTGAIRASWTAYLGVIHAAVEQGAPPEFDLFEANQEIIERVRDDEDFDKVHEDVCSALVGPARDLVRKIAGIIEDAIRYDELKIRVFRLGRLVEQGARPRDVYRHMAGYPEDHDHPTEQSWWLTTRETRPGEVMPGAQWFGEVVQRWQELGVPSPLPASFSRLAAGDADVAVCDVIEEIDSVAYASLGSQKSPPPEDLEGWIINSKRRVRKALGRSETNTEYLKKLEDEAEVEIKKTLTGKTAFRFKDSALHALVASELAKNKERPNPSEDGV